MESNITLLIVDDEERYCLATKRWLSKACGCGVEYACDPSKAETILRQNPIKVIIFDWDMPKMKGTELHAKLRLINNKYKSVLLSGQAPIETMANADGTFDRSIVKDKDDKLLPSIILELFLQYDQSEFSSSVSPFFIEKVGGLFSKHRISYSVSSTQILNSRVIDPSSWIMRNEVNDTIRAGEEKTFSTEKSSSQSKSTSQNATETSSQSIAAQLGLPANVAVNFDSSFSREIEKSLQTTTTYAESQTETKTWKRALPADGDVLYERFETAAVYLKIRVFITTSFSWSQQKYLNWYDRLIPTKTVAARFYQCKKDGTIQYIDAGMYAVHQ